MTYIEKYKRDHPGLSDDEYRRFMIKNCPYGLDGQLIHCPKDLRAIGMPNDERCPICWNREIPGTEPTNNKTTNEREDGNMSKKFTKDDLKVGYIVRIKGDNEIRMVMETNKDGTVIVKKDGWFVCLSSFNSDLTHKRPTSLGDFTITEVYGYRDRGGDACEFSTNGRERLWKREPEKTCDSCAHKVVCTHVGMCEHYTAKN